MVPKRARRQEGCLLHQRRVRLFLQEDPQRPLLTLDADACCSYIRSPYCMKEFIVAQTNEKLLVVVCDTIGNIMSVSPADFPHASNALAHFGSSSHALLLPIQPAKRTPCPQTPGAKLSSMRSRTKRRQTTLLRRFSRSWPSCDECDKRFCQQRWPIPFYIDSSASYSYASPTASREGGKQWCLRTGKSIRVRHAPPRELVAAAQPRARSGHHVPPVLLGSFARFFFIACQPATAVPDSATPNPAASERDFEAGTIIQIALARVRGYLGQSGRVGACTFALRRGGGCRLAVVVAVALGAKTFQNDGQRADNRVLC